MTRTIPLLIYLLCTIPLQAFQVSIFPTQKAAFSVHLQMVPKYDPATSRWTPTSPEEEASAGYSPIGSLIRQGPSPFIQRVTDSDSYDQGVLKMMSKDKMSRNEAQGNMDAYIRNPNDWALQKLEEKNGAEKYDYANANMDPLDILLTTTWATIILTFLSRFVYLYTVGCDAFCQEYHF